MGTKPFTDVKGILDREMEKFSEALDGTTAINVVDVSKLGWTEINVTRPNALTEVFTYEDADSVVIGVMTVTYADSDREILLSAVWS